MVMLVARPVGRGGSDRMQTALARHFATRDGGLYCSDRESESLTRFLLNRHRDVEPMAVGLGRTTLPWL